VLPVCRLNFLMLPSIMATIIAVFMRAVYERSV
jgi:hypothetical protein